MNKLIQAQVIDDIQSYFWDDICNPMANSIDSQIDEDQSTIVWDHVYEEVSRVVLLGVQIHIHTQIDPAKTLIWFTP